MCASFVYLAFMEGLAHLTSLEISTSLASFSSLAGIYKFCKCYTLAEQDLATVCKCKDDSGGAYWQTCSTGTQRTIYSGNPNDLSLTDRPSTRIHV